MKFFLDTANLDELKKGASWGIVDGVTTNPSLIAKEGRPIEEQVRMICDIVDGDISAEVVSTEAGAMIAEGHKLAKIHKNIVVKCPLTRDGIMATIGAEQGRHPRQRDAVLLGGAGAAGGQGRRLHHQPVRRAVGRYRLRTGMDLIRSIMQIYKNYGYKTQVLAASLRSPTHVIDSALAGAHIGTMPFKVLDMLFNHPLTDKGLEQFLKDWAKVFHEAPAR